MNYHEQAFVSAFVLPEKRGRYAEFLAQPRRRGEILDRFNHCFDLVPALATRLPRSSPGEWAALLRQRDASVEAHLIGRGACDGCDLPLDKAIEHAWVDGWGVVVSCVPGRLALYLQEFPPGDAFLLARR